MAELEATTARKGNREMSLTITGQVHRMVMWWDDGHSNGTLYGIDNSNFSSRFSFLGVANVTSRVKVGFEIMIDLEPGGTSSRISQFDSDGKGFPQISGNAGVKSFTGSNVDSFAANVRRMAFWIQDAELGRVMVGRYEAAGAVGTIDLGGIRAGASPSVVLVNGSFLLRGPAGQYYAIGWVNLGLPAVYQARTQLVRYDSPTWNGFIYSASIAEDGTYWGTMLRYANKFWGFRVAAGIGYENATQRQASLGCPDPVTPPCGAGPNDLAVPAPNVQAWGVGLSALHVPTGLFAQGHYMHADFDEDNPGSGSGAGAFWGQTAPGRIPAQQWLIQGGITKNWFGFGNTAIFGEYSRNEGWGARGGPLAPNGASFSNGTIPGSVAVNGVTDTAMNVRGAGITQNVDAAATELYLDWRHFEADIKCNGLTVGGNVCAGKASSANPTQKLPTESFDAIIGGALVKF